jgi:hypothetical protein
LKNPGSGREIVGIGSAGHYDVPRGILAHGVDRIDASRNLRIAVPGAAQKCGPAQAAAVSVELRHETVVGVLLAAADGLHHASRDREVGRVGSAAHRGDAIAIHGDGVDGVGPELADTVASAEAVGGGASQQRRVQQAVAGGGKLEDETEGARSEGTAPGAALLEGIGADGEVRDVGPPSGIDVSAGIDG